MGGAAEGLVVQVVVVQLLASVADDALQVATGVADVLLVLQLVVV